MATATGRQDGMALHHRSDCPLNRAVELLGDRWSLLLLRDISRAGDAHFRALLESSCEGISASVLADRLQVLLDHGVLAREACPGHRQRMRYHLTAAGRELLPVMRALADWGQRYCPEEGTEPRAEAADHSDAAHAAVASA